MKKLMAFALVLAMALSLCACGGAIDEETQKKLDLYDKYEEYIQMLENQEYEALILKLAELYQAQQGGGDDPEDPENPDNPDVPEVPAEPTQAEQNALQQYREIVYALNNGNSWVSEYDENGDYIGGYSDQEALRFCYEKLQELTVADQWIEWCKDRWGEELNWDRQDLLSNFSMLTDVPLSQKWTTVDHMDNQYADSTSWTYWADGMIASANPAFEIIESDPMNIGRYNTRYYTYDDAGRVTQIKYGSEDYTEYLVTLTYDAAGNKVGEHIKSNNGEWDFTYSYDGMNRLVQIEYPYSFGSDTVVTVTYTYDAAGNVVKEERVVHYYNAWVEADVISSKEITEYTYDAGGKLVSGVYTKESWGYNEKYDSSVERWVLTEQYMDTQRQDQYAFTCDDQGRPLTLVITYGDEYYVYGDNAGQVSGTANDVSRTYEFLYGDYYFYNAE